MWTWTKKPSGPISNGITSRGQPRLLGNDIGPLSIWTKLNKGSPLKGSLELNTYNSTNCYYCFQNLVLVVCMLHADCRFLAYPPGVQGHPMDPTIGILVALTPDPDPDPDPDRPMRVQPKCLDDRSDGSDSGALPHHKPHTRARAHTHTHTGINAMQMPTFHSLPLPSDP